MGILYEVQKQNNRFIYHSSPAACRGPWVSFAQEPGTRRQGGAHLLFFCAAGIRPPVEDIVKLYERETGGRVDLQYGGSKTLLNQLEVSKAADLYLAADDSYLQRAIGKGLVRETIPVASMVPVIAVPRGNPQGIEDVQDLLRANVRIALGNPEAVKAEEAGREEITSRDR